MKIKYLLPLLLCFPVFLLAQVSEPVKHVGTSNPFQIGRADYPVIVEELVDFLNTKERYNTYRDYWKDLLEPSMSYYDSALMDESSNENCICFINSVECFKQPGVYFQPCIGGVIISGPQPYYHIYSVKQGCESMIVDAVSSREVQQQFNQWRQNPTVKEICDYINDLNHAVNESDENHDLLHNPAWNKTEEIENRYPNSKIFLTAYGLAEKICAGTTRITLAKMIF